MADEYKVKKTGDNEYTVEKVEVDTSSWTEKCPVCNKKFKFDDGYFGGGDIMYCSEECYLENIRRSKEEAAKREEWRKKPFSEKKPKLIVCLVVLLIEIVLFALILIEAKQYGTVVEWLIACIVILILTIRALYKWLPK